MNRFEGFRYIHSMMVWRKLSTGSYMIKSWHSNAFRITGCLWGYLPVIGGSLQEEQGMRPIHISWDVNWKKLLNKQSSCRLFKTHSWYCGFAVTWIEYIPWYTHGSVMLFFAVIAIYMQWINVHSLFAICMIRFYKISSLLQTVSSPLRWFDSIVAHFLFKYSLTFYHMVFYFSTHYVLAILSPFPNGLWKDYNTVVIKNNIGCV